MLKIREAIVVEGRYDKIALEPLVDTVMKRWSYSAGWRRVGGSSSLRIRTGLAW